MGLLAGAPLASPGFTPKGAVWRAGRAEKRSGEKGRAPKEGAETTKGEGNEKGEEAAKQRGGRVLTYRAKKLQRT